MSEREGPGKVETDDGRPQVSRSEPQASEDHQVGSEAKPSEVKLGLNQAVRGGASRQLRDHRVGAEKRHRGSCDESRESGHGRDSFQQVIWTAGE